MRILQVVPKEGIGKTLKSQLNAKERELREKKTTFSRVHAGRWTHTAYDGSIDWDEVVGGIIVARVRCRNEINEWQLLTAFIGYLDRHFGDQIESISIIFR